MKVPSAKFHFIFLAHFKRLRFNVAIDMYLPPSFDKKINPRSVPANSPILYFIRQTSISETSNRKVEILGSSVVYETFVLNQLHMNAVSLPTMKTSSTLN